MKKFLVTVLLASLTACVGDDVSPDAPVNPCCDLGAEGAAKCFSEELPAGTCAVFVCPSFRGEACGPAKPDPQPKFVVGEPPVSPLPR